MSSLLQLTICFLAASGGSGNPAATELVGSWRAQIPQDVVNVSKKLGLSQPQAQFVFKGDNTFSYNSTAAGAIRICTGAYQVTDHSVKLSTQSGNWPSGMVVDLRENNSLDFDGLHYLKQAPCSMEGTWKLAGDGSTKIVFTKDGKFNFRGSAATSKGKYAVDGNQVTLTWTDIDGEEVEPGTVHKAFCLDDDGTLKIDSYRYVKQ